MSLNIYLLTLNISNDNSFFLFFFLFLCYIFSLFLWISFCWHRLKTHINTEDGHLEWTQLICYLSVQNHRVKWQICAFNTGLMLNWKWYWICLKVKQWNKSSFTDLKHILTFLTEKISPRERQSDVLIVCM